VKPKHFNVPARPAIPRHLEGDCRAVASFWPVGNEWSVFVIALFGAA